jgi:hypothetical protein
MKISAINVILTWRHPVLRRGKRGAGGEDNGREYD